MISPATVISRRRLYALLLMTLDAYRSRDAYQPLCLRERQPSPALHYEESTTAEGKRQQRVRADKAGRVAPVLQRARSATATGRAAKHVVTFGDKASIARHAR